MITTNELVITTVNWPLKAVLKTDYMYLVMSMLITNTQKNISQNLYIDHTTQYYIAKIFPGSLDGLIQQTEIFSE